jgi:hypothetical protein
MDRITTYCELDFIDNFLNNIPKASLLELFINGNNDIDGFKVLYSLIFERSNLVINKSKQELATSDDPFHKMLLRGYTDGYSRLIDLGEAFTNEFDQNGELAEFPNHIDSLFLLNKFGVNKIKELGFFNTNITSNYIKQVQDLSYQKKYFVAPNHNQENMFQGWDFLSKMNFPINSAIISDNFLLDKSDTYKYNVFQIIKNLLPKSLGCDFHLTFLIKEGFYNEVSRINHISNFISELERPYAIKLSIYLTPANEPHDRDIITNYYWIHSGHSLDYFNSNGNLNRTTHLDFIGLLSGKNLGNYQVMKKILSFYKKILHGKRSLLEDAPFYTEPFNNRLLD